MPLYYFMDGMLIKFEFEHMLEEDPKQVRTNVPTLFLRLSSSYSPLLLNFSELLDI